MIVDTSALLSLVFREEDCAEIEACMVSAESLSMSTANWFEGTLRTDRLTDQNVRERYDRYVSELSIYLTPVSAHHAQLARTAYQTYGKGIHPAGLNFGDCFAYALAKATSRPLLFKGNDFSQTDIIPALQKR